MQANSIAPPELSKLIKEFFSWQSATETNKDLWLIFRSSLSSDTFDRMSKIERADMAWVYEKISNLLFSLEKIHSANTIEAKE